MIAIAVAATVTMPILIAPPTAEQNGSDKPGSAAASWLNTERQEPDRFLQSPILAAIQHWLAVEFGLPEFDGQPRIEFAPPAKLVSLRYRGLLPMTAMGDAARDGLLSPGVAAVYVGAGETIYLSDAWTGRTPADMSVLVHEMVHHIQNRAALRFECPQARERLAYEAQERWLKRFGRSLAQDFELDDFSLLPMTRCMH